MGITGLAIPKIFLSLKVAKNALKTLISLTISATYFTKVEFKSPVLQLCRSDCCEVKKWSG
jgi:hypothetical protein